ncbi:MAG: polysaccharide deacetylase family protein, partial [Chthoniobacterales bacterium]
MRRLMKLLSPVLVVSALCVAACAQERSDVALRSGSSSALHPHSPSISVTSEGVAPRPPRVPAQYNSVNMSRPIVALTFDDGPHPELTPKLLDILRQNGVRATFYVIGRNVETYPDIARRIVAEGHEIANHSWSHPALTSLSAGR